MSIRVPADRLRQVTFVAGIVFVLQSGPSASAAAATADGAALVAATPTANTIANRSSPARAPYEMLIARVFVNTVNKGDIPIVRDVDGRVLVPAVQFEQWGLSLAHAAPITVAGEPYIVVSGIEGLAVKFDEKTVTLDLQVAAKALPTTTVNLGPQHRGDMIYPTDTSVFLNYGLNANGDDSFGQRRY